jgi:hypothetical protein
MLRGALPPAGSMFATTFREVHRTDAIYTPGASQARQGAMSFLGWMAAGGVLLLTMALSSALIQRLPVSTAAIYLAVGCVIGPWGFDLLRIESG